jgi:hypothetical protein
MSELLGSASLLVGVAGLIYSVWYAEIKAALDLTVPTYGRDPLVKQVHAAIWHRSLPITLIVVALTIALVPPAWGVLTGSVSAVMSGHIDYDAVNACFVIVFAALVVLSVACARDLLGLNSIRRRLNAPIDSVSEK